MRSDETNLQKWQDSEVTAIFTVTDAYLIYETCTEN